MAIQVNIDDSKVENFSKNAREALRKKVEQYAYDIIKEANLIEEGIREDDASTEITSNIVSQAVRKKQSIVGKKATAGYRILRIVSPISILFTGLLFDIKGFSNQAGKWICFLLLLTIAIISTVLIDVKE